MVLRKVMDRRLLHRLALAAVILLAAAAGMSATGGTWRIAPLNPAFVAYARDRAAGIITATGAEERGLGYIPAPVDLSHLSGQRLFTADQLSLPASFDLRTTGKLTPVKDQGNCGSCWAFATYASMESNLLPGETRDFSENNMKNTHGFDLAHDKGGNQFISTAYLTRWSGPVDEADDPYNPSSGFSPPGLPARKHVQEVIFLPDRCGPLDNDAIKQAVMTYGAVFTSMYYSSSYYNAATYSYHCSYDINSNHAVAIVGWDDNYDRTKFTSVPAGDGAFIIKNSWGPTWGEGGYFYVSYYDATIGTNNALFLNAEPVTNFRRIYQYDPLGWVGNLGIDTDTAWMANIFTADGMGQLSAAAFYTAAINTSYELRIYAGVSPGQPTSGTLQSTQTGTIPMPGFHTVKLATPVPIAEGQRFSVVLKLAMPGYSYPIPVEAPAYGYSSQATANAGESYISVDGSVWSDLTSIHGNTNVCLKAYMDNLVATPEFSPGGGTYDTPQTVTISCATPDVTIHYTTDGAEPTALDPIVVSGTAVQVNTSMILRARAFKDGWAPSSIKTAEYTITGTTGTAAAPSFSQGTGTYNAPQTVTITCLNSEAQIRYTLNGPDPTETSPLYEGPIEIATTGTTLKARVYKPGWDPSPVTSATYELVVSTPAFSPDGGTITNTVNVAISCATPGAEIRYTTDGITDPTPASPLYQGPVAIDTTTTLKARAFRTGMVDSPVKSAVYTLRVATPVIYPNGGVYNYARTVEISCATEGAVIRYTLDGSEPTSASTEYLGSFTLDTSCTIKAKAFKSGGQASDTSQASFTFQVPQPHINLSSSTYYSPQTLVISYATGAVVHYTTDGSEPTLSSPEYTSPIAINVTTIVKAKAFRTGWLPSDTKTVQVTLKVSPPVLDLQYATANIPIDISASCPTEGVSLHYTTDDTDPTETSPVYTGSVKISASAQLRMKAFKTGWVASDVVAGLYEITDALPESAHPYSNELFYSWIYKLSGNHDAIMVTFAPETKLGLYSDRIYVMDASGMNIPGSPFIRTALAGRSVMVPGDTVKIKLESDGNIGDYGLRVTEIADAHVATPGFSLASGTYSSAQAVMITDATPGSTIHYSTDGHEPTEYDPVARSGQTIIVGNTLVLKARAFKKGRLPSEVQSAEYIITGTVSPVAMPEITPNGGNIIAPGLVSLACSTSGSEIHYTIDGSVPTESSPIYTTPLSIDTSMTLKARAFKAGYAPSPINTAIFVRKNGCFVNAHASGPNHDGSTWQSAYLTVQEAIDHTSIGGEVWVAAAEYRENLTMRNGVSIYGGFSGMETAREQRDWQLNRTILDGNADDSVITANNLSEAIRIDGFVITNGYSVDKGGGISGNGVTASICNNVIQGNSVWSTSGGGIYLINASGEITNNTITKNSATFSGGALYVIATPTGVRISKNHIERNDSGDEPVFCKGNIELSHNVIIWNYSTFSGNVCGTVICGSSTKVTNNIIAYNDGIMGGGVYCQGTGVIIKNNTIIGNNASQGAGIFVNGLDAQIINNIIAFNDSGIYVDSYASAVIRNNCVFGNTEYDYQGATAGSGDISVDPAFVAINTMNLHLLASSPCINAGQNMVIDPGMLDLDGKQRIQGLSVDLGAYECSTVAMPDCTPAGGIFAVGQDVTINCATEGVTLYYTVNGSDPSPGDLVVIAGETVTVSTSAVLKVRGFRDGWEPSPVMSTEYMIGGSFGNVATPVFYPEASTFDREQLVTITCATPGALIYYTLGGSDPNESSTLYQGPILIDTTNTILKARAYKPGWNPSAIASSTYLITVATPVFSLAAGTFNTEQSVTVTCPTPGAEIRYTIDGSEPTNTSQLYQGPITISNTTTLKAAAYRAGMTGSQVNTAVYTLQVLPVTFYPYNGQYSSAQNVTMGCQTPGVVIHYTTDGQEPTESSPVYSSAISIDMPTTFKAKAYKTGWKPSETASVTYQFKAANPLLLPWGRTFDSVQTVTFYCSSQGAQMRYTIDGTEPTAISTLYTGAITIDRTMTVKAKAFKNGWLDSDTTTEVYTMQLPAPIMTPGGGQFNRPQAVVLSCAVNEAEIRYTIDGSEPTAVSAVYQMPIYIDSQTTIKAKAFKNGWTASDITESTYVFSDILPETQHPYANNLDTQYVYTLEGDLSQLYVTFDTQTNLNSGDLIYVMDENNINVPGSPFYRDLLAGRTVAVPGKTVRIRITTDSFSTGYGFRVTAIEGNRVAKPVITLDSVSHSPTLLAQLTCATPGASIHYTLDGRTPTEDDPSVMNGNAIPIARSLILKARAFKDGFVTSDVSEAECTVNGSTGTLAAPSFSIKGGTIISPVQVSIYAQQGAEIRYTTDGSIPTQASALYQGALTISTTTTLKARAYMVGWSESPVTSETYTRKNGKYVDKNASGPVHDGSSWEKAYLTIQAAINATSSGGELWVADGIYNEGITMKSGVSLYGGFCGIETTREQMDPKQYTSIIINERTSPVVRMSSIYTPIILDGFYIYGSDEFNYHVIDCSTSLLTIRNCVIQIKCIDYGAAAIYINGSYAPIITNNMILGIGDGIHCLNASPVITNNVIFCNEGIICEGVTSLARIMNNTIVYSYDAITIKSQASPLISNNIIAYQRRYGINLVQGSPQINYNCFYGNASSDYHGVSPGIGDFNADPKFVLPKGDWRLGLESPCINTGNDAYAMPGDTDLAGHPRLAGAHVDIGAYERSTIAQPTFTPDGGFYATSQIVTIACSTPDVSIYYTMDGSEPTLSSTPYTGPVAIDPANHVILRAKAFRDGWADSLTATTHYYYLVVADPLISLAGGTYGNAQTVILACATPGAEIHYTLDGSDPTLASPLYSEPLCINGNTSLKARAFLIDWLPSGIVSVSYTFEAITPVFSINGGRFDNPQTVIITSATSEATIRYTMDGTDPTEQSPEYTGPIHVDASTTLKARAFKAGYTGSAIQNAVFTFTAADPVISPNGGTFGEPQTVTIGCGTAGAMVRYTVDGTDPTGASPEYVGPFIVEAGATVKARAFKTGYAASGITVADFNFALAAPVFNPGGGTYHAAQKVSLYCATAGAVIRYTTDGGEPTLTSDEYTGPITIDAMTVLKAKAFRAGWTASPTATASYVFKAPAPTVNPPGGTYNTPLAVTASCAGAGAVIRYTTDGTEPTDSSPIHTGPIPVETAAFLKFKAFKPGWDAGETLAVNYTILGRRFSFQPGDGGAYSTLKTAQARRDDPYTQWQGTTLSLGRGVSGRPSDLWLWFPQIMGGNTGQVPGTGKIIHAKLVLRLAEIAGDPSRSYRLKIYRITDPDGRGAPAFGTADGLRTGLDFMYRDHRLGMNVRWADGAENILALFADTQPLDAIEFIPAELAAQGIDAIQLDVTAAVRAWMDGAPNQGWFVCLDGEWAAGQMLAFHGAAAAVQALRPYLEVLYTPAGGDVEPPAAGVGSFSAVTGPGSVTLAWLNPAADPDFSGVKIVRKPGIVPFDPYDGDLVYDGPGEACADSGLVDGKPYYYAAFAYDSLRNYGPKAWLLAVPGTPAAPVLNAAAGAGYVQLTWNTVDGADRYRVYRRDGSGARLIKEVSAPSYDDFNLSMQPYDYWVTAVKDGCGEGKPSNIVTAAPSPASWTPATPANLAAAAVSNTEIRLTWEDRSDNEVAFALERRPDGEEIWLPIAAPAFNTQSFVDTNLDPGTTYVYRLKAISWDQESGWAESNPAATGNAPLAPADLTWTVISAGRVNLAWTDRAANETGYRVHVTGGDGSAWTLELPAGAEFCSVTGLRAGVAYRFRVEAWNLDGGSTVESETVMTAVDPKDGLL